MDEVCWCGVCEGETATLLVTESRRCVRETERVPLWLGAAEGVSPAAVVDASMVAVGLRWVGVLTADGDLATEAVGVYGSGVDVALGVADGVAVRAVGVKDGKTNPDGVTQLEWVCWLVGVGAWVAVRVGSSEGVSATVAVIVLLGVVVAASVGDVVGVGGCVRVAVVGWVAVGVVAGVGVRRSVWVCVGRLEGVCGSVPVDVGSIVGVGVGTRDVLGVIGNVAVGGLLLGVRNKVSVGLEVADEVRSWECVGT